MKNFRTAVTLFAAVALIALVAFAAPAHRIEAPPGVHDIVAAVNLIAAFAAPVRIAPDIAIRFEKEAKQAEQASTIAARTMSVSMIEATSQYQNLEAEQAEQAPTITARTHVEPMTEATNQYQLTLFRISDYGSHPLPERWRLT